MTVALADEKAMRTWPGAQSGLGIGGGVSFVVTPVNATTAAPAGAATANARAASAGPITR